MHKVPLLDLGAQFQTIETEVRQAIDGVLATQRFIMGPEVEDLEKEIADYVQCTHAIGVTSGSDALLASLMVLGIGPGDEVITTPYTFFATVGAISRLGAKPVFVDIEPRSFNLDPTQIERRITPKTKAMIPVHLYGQAADMISLTEICNKHRLAVVEDAAQAIGTEFQGKRAGSFGTTSCFSFFPSKNLGGMGDGGMITTQDEGLADKIRIFRNHGSKPKYFHAWVGGNFRLDALQAAILRVKLKHLDSWTEGRQRNANRYDQLIQETDLEEFVLRPWRREGDRHIFNQYVIRAQRRDELRKHLQEAGIGTEIYYPVPMHLQECFASLRYKEGDFPEAEKAAKESLALPIYPELTEAQQVYVIDSIRSFYR